MQPRNSGAGHRPNTGKNATRRGIFGEPRTIAAMFSSVPPRGTDFRRRPTSGACWSKIGRRTRRADRSPSVGRSWMIRSRSAQGFSTVWKIIQELITGSPGNARQFLDHVHFTAKYTKVTWRTPATASATASPPSLRVDTRSAGGLSRYDPADRACGADGGLLDCTSSEAVARRRDVLRTRATSSREPKSRASGGSTRVGRQIWPAGDATRSGRRARQAQSCARDHECNAT